MVALDELLHRFRFHGVPGAPAIAGVPSDRANTAAAELAPIFIALEPAQRQTSNLLVAAEERAARMRAAAEQEAQRLIEEARAGAAAAREEAAETLLARAQAERRRVLDEGRAQAERVARVATERMPAVTDSVVDWVLALPERQDLDP